MFLFDSSIGLKLNPGGGATIAPTFARPLSCSLADSHNPLYDRRIGLIRLFVFGSQCKMRAYALGQLPPGVLGTGNLNRGKVGMEAHRRPTTRREPWERIYP